MAKKKTTKSATEGARRVARGVFVTWRNALNCDRSKLQTLPVAAAAAAAREAGYEFFVYNHDLYFFPAAGAPVKLDVPGAKLDAGVMVHVYGDGTIASVEPKEKKLYVVTRIAYDYDDENYFTVGDGAGHAAAVFDNKDEAEKVARKGNVDELIRVDDLFDYVVTYDLRYSAIVAMPWAVWQDWLRDHGIEPPALDVAGDDDVVDHRALQAWWTRGMGGRTWDATAGRYVASAGGWSDEQKRAAAEHINIDFYRVDEVPFHE